jgi:putative acetyltransferase
MKIRELNSENYVKASALLRQAFPGSTYEMRLFENLHKNGRDLHEWVCLHTNRVIAYIAFSNAYKGSKVFGLHLARLAVTPDFQKQGIGSELLRFALRQNAIKEEAVFVLGDPVFYQKFGFKLCATPICPFDKNNAHFLGVRNSTDELFTVGYEPEFMIGT